MSDISGRGVGLGPVMAVTKDLGGRISVSSEAGLGTTLRMVFSVDAMAPGLVLLLADAV